jgi:hypothetical protein
MEGGLALDFDFSASALAAIEIDIPNLEFGSTFEITSSDADLTPSIAVSVGGTVAARIGPRWRLKLNKLATLFEVDTAVALVANMNLDFEANNDGGCLSGSAECRFGVDTRSSGFSFPNFRDLSSPRSV